MELVDFFNVIGDCQSMAMVCEQAWKWPIYVGEFKILQEISDNKALRILVAIPDVEFIHSVLSITVYHGLITQVSGQRQTKVSVQPDKKKEW